MKKGLAGAISSILAVASMVFFSFSIEALTVVPAAGQSVSGTPSGKPQRENSRIG